MLKDSEIKSTYRNTNSIKLITEITKYTYLIEFKHSLQTTVIHSTPNVH